MMIELKIRRIGNSLGVVLPEEAIDRLGVNVGDSLFLVETPDGFYLLTKSNPADERAHLGKVQRTSAFPQNDSCSNRHRISSK